MWAASSAPYAAGLLFLLGIRQDISEAMSTTRFWLETGSSAATAIAAAFAAMSAVVPGRSLNVLMLPVASAGIWLGSVLWGMATADRSGMAAPFLSGWLCLPCTALLGFIPSLVMMTMLRRGALLTPYLNTGLGGLAAASLGVTALRFAQPIDDPLMVLAWQGGTVALLSLAASLSGIFLSRSFRPPIRQRQHHRVRRRDSS